MIYRGHYDVRMYPKFIQLHGKTYDYKITYTSILRLFLLPNKDHRQMFFVVSLQAPNTKQLLKTNLSDKYGPSFETRTNQIPFPDHAFREGARSFSGACSRVKSFLLLHVFH